MTKQETFDIVVAHLRKQGKQAIGVKGGCRYRLETPGGTLKCAAGCLLPDDLYDPAFEGRPIANDNSLGALFSELGHSVQLVVDLQRIHDQHSVCNWEEKFQTVANKYNLTFYKKSKIHE